MKKNFTFIIAILISTQVFAQKLPEQKKFDYDNSYIYLQNHSDFQYPTNTYFLGFHWGEGKFITNALGMNIIHCPINIYTDDYLNVVYNDTLGVYDERDYADSCLMIMRSAGIGGNWGGWNPKDARALHYNPVIQASEFNDTTFDATNGFIGFKNISPTAIKSGRSLYLDSISTNSGLILSDNFLANRIEFQLLKDTTRINNNCLHDTILPSDLNSENLYFSINLRRTFIVDNLFNSDTVLTIRLKYITTRDTNTHSRYSGYVKFNALPDTNQTAIDTLPNNRGLIRKTINGNNDTYLVITRAMLPPANTNERDITISAKMLFNSPSAIPNNYYFKKFNFTLDTSGQAIDSLKIEVSYTKKFSCALNWLRIETRPAMDIYRGRWDSLITYRIHQDIDALSSQNSILKQKGLKPFRWYLKDEYTLDYWATNRYFYKLIGPVFTSEIGSEYCQLHSSYFGNVEQWHSQFGFPSHGTAPYITKGAEIANIYTKKVPAFGSKYYLGLYRAYDQWGHNDTFYDIAPVLDTLIYPNKTFESVLNGSLENYEKGFIEQYQLSPVAYNEVSIYNSLAKQNARKYIFSDKPWWGQYFQLVQVKIDQNYLNFGDFRPKTGEEIRSFIDKLMILGAKGIMTDGEKINFSALRMAMPQHYLEDTLNIQDNEAFENNGYTFLKRTDIGSDYLIDSLYLDYKQDTTTINLGKYYQLDTLSQYLGVNRDKVYIGSRSTRLEAKKEYDKINFNAGTLLSLRLQSWLGKGFRKWVLNHPKYGNSDFLSNFIDTNNIKTRPIGRMQDDMPFYEQHLTIDSGFYDITILSDINDSTMSNSYYLGIQNRRLNPLIYLSSNDITTNQLTDYSVGWNFIPTAELDQLCDGADSTFWRSKYFSRLGSREIKLPFNYQNPSSPGQEYILKIQELMDSSSYNPNWTYWRKEKWNRKVDTLILYNGDLTLNYLPGESRMFKVTLQPKRSFRGELEYSAQNKMVVYPTQQTNQKDFSYKDSSVYYHLVYEKKDSITNNYNVYYRRSVPISPSLKGTNIEWEPNEYLLSKTHKITPVIEPGISQNYYQNQTSDCDCKYPTITVRFDSVSNEVMAYVVYNCKRMLNDDSLKNYIVETVFPANYFGSPIIPDTSNVIEFAYHGTPNNPQGRWGIPTINASYSGNYYSWADSIRGIMIGWKTPQNRNVIINKQSVIGAAPNVKYLHPNLNTYSRMPIEENSCSLVWEGDSVNSNDIYYTRISRNSRGNIIPSIYLFRLDTTQPEFDRSIRTSTYAKFLNSGTQFPTFPSIHKPVSYKLRSGYETADSIHYAKNGWDRVVFMDKESDFTHKDIYIKALDYSDSLQGENHLPTTNITVNYIGRLIYPFITQGNISGENGTFHQMVGADSSLILTFTEQSTTQFNVYQFNLDFWSPFLDPDSSVWTPRTLNLYLPNNINQNYLHHLGEGIYAHPSNSPITNKQSDFWLTKTVFQKDGIIQGASPKLMYKGANLEKVATNFIGFNSSKSENSSSITPIYLDDGNYLPITYGEIMSNKKLVFYDTMKTDWFKIQELKKIGFTYFSIKDTSFKIYIQKQSDKSVYEIKPLYLTKKAKINRITCINGRNDNYRLLFVKNDATFMINKNIVLGYENEFINRMNFFEEEPLYKQGTDNSQLIDLNPENFISGMKLGLSVYPNPANDELYVVCYLPQSELLKNQDLKSDLQLKLFDNLGKEVYSKQIRAGQVIRIATDNLQSGNYFVKVFQQDLTTIPAEVRSVIIER